MNAEAAQQYTSVETHQVTNRILSVLPPGGEGGLTLASSDNPFSDTVGTPSRLAYSMNTVCYSTLENLTKKETLLWQTGYSPQPPTW